MARIEQKLDALAHPLIVLPRPGPLPLDADEDLFVEPLPAPGWCR
jgi:hypothetical protein